MCDNFMSHTLHTATVQFAGSTVKSAEILLLFLVKISILLIKYIFELRFVYACLILLSFAKNSAYWLC